MLRSYRAAKGLDYVALRYFNVYGPRMDVHGVYTEVLAPGFLPVLFSNPVFVDVDGNGRFDAPGLAP